MKDKLIDEVRGIFSQSVEWVRLEVEYAKLTMVEKFTILAGMAILGAVIMMLALPLIIMLLFALEKVFRLIMCPILSYLATGGVVLVLILLVYFLRKPLIFNPIARLLTKVLVDHNVSKK